jgi:translation elongation factor EF-Tu-like GTPase
MGIFNIFSKKEDISGLGKFAFVMQIDDTFSLIPTGVVVVGIIKKGKIYTNSDIMIIDKKGNVLHKKNGVGNGTIPQTCNLR